MCKVPLGPNESKISEGNKNQGLTIKFTRIEESPLQNTKRGQHITAIDCGVNGGCKSRSTVQLTHYESH